MTRPASILIVRRRRCGCRLGSVVRSPDGGLLFVGVTRSLVYDSPDVPTAQLDDVVVPLSDPEPVDLGCEHGAGEPLHLDGMRAAAERATRMNTVFLI